MEQWKRDFLNTCNHIDALQFGKFTLKSGRESPYFFNAGKFNTGDSLMRLGYAYAKATLQSGISPEVFYGPAYKGIPLATATSTAYDEMYFPKETGWCFNRKEEKTHGDGGILVGASLDNKRVLITDDVITSGSSVHESVRIIKRNGGIPVGVCIGLDREECGTKTALSGAEEITEKYDIPVLSIIGLTDLIGFCESDSSLAKYVSKITSYRDRYGVKNVA